MFYDHDGTFRGVKGTIDDDEAEDLHEVRWSDPPNLQIHELMGPQVETETCPRGVTPNREGTHHRRSTERQISPRRFCGLHPLPVRFNQGFYSRL